MAQPFVKLMQSIYIYLIDNDEIWDNTLSVINYMSCFKKWENMMNY